jgi:hypothetical protein
MLCDTEDVWLWEARRRCIHGTASYHLQAKPTVCFNDNMSNHICTNRKLPNRRLSIFSSFRSHAIQPVVDRSCSKVHGPSNQVTLGLFFSIFFLRRCAICHYRGQCNNNTDMPTQEHAGRYRPTRHKITIHKTNPTRLLHGAYMNIYMKFTSHPTRGLPIYWNNLAARHQHTVQPRIHLPGF